ncbi:MAG: iron-sulfur cluster-binding protein [Chloroflexi bacterium]|nr:iron-sulfur cluster-binding protein [Chloroflexota bacterium]
MTHTPNVTFYDFRKSAAKAVNDPNLQRAVDGATLRFRTHRAEALAELPDSDALRDHLKAIRAATLACLADHLETFERNAQAAGAHVHWARDAADAQRIVVEIAQQHDADLVVKSKSMATEEIHLNDALLAAGIEPVETDLGEWIIQLAGEPPSHIIGPALHKTRQQVAELFNRKLGTNFTGDDIPGMTEQARRVLREKFLSASIGISGVNVAVAETGSIVLVTNEGNGRMVTSAPPVHIAVMGLEKLAPTWDDAAVWLSLLGRSATGQPLSIYTATITGPAQADDPDGPQEVHIVLLDNGRSALLGGKYEEILQCIRCGACLNICPVYQEVSGHAYGSPYSGPIGAVITPLLFGLEEYEALPHASSLCGACLDVCPARIDLPRMLLELRADEVEQRIIPRQERLLEGSAAWVLGRPRLFRFLTGLGRFFQRPLARNGSLRLPRGLNPARDRQLPALAPRSFRELWDDGLSANDATSEEEGT